MTPLLTRPIPNRAIRQELREQVRRAQPVQPYLQNGPFSTDHNIPEVAMIAAAAVQSARTPWEAAQDSAAQVALMFLISGGSSMATWPSTGEYLYEIMDEGITRPLMNIRDVQASRAEASLRPMELSLLDAVVLRKALADGTARPRIDVRPL